MLLKVTDRDGHRVIFFLLDQRQTFRGRFRINVLFLVEDCFVSALLISSVECDFSVVQRENNTK